ncbi:MAG: nuclear transport factor 2 family protein [Bacteroidales bacterium]|nr:nuclear transport factor 2 family protein [Bacteroidales bacterium]MDT8372397.1 nuclear transport factor 2 family protein [Bacteroidales bacterium]
MKSKLLILLLLLMAACTTNKPMTEEQKAAVLDEASTVVKEYFDAIATSNSEKVASLIEKSDDYLLIVMGELLDYETSVAMMEANLPYVEKQTFETKFEKYTVIDPTCFIYNWHGRNGIYMSSGETAMLEDYLITCVFRKHADGWKYFMGHESEKAPMPVELVEVQ